MINYNNKLVFNKLIAEIEGTFLNRTINKYNGDFRTQHFDTKSQLFSLIYSNLANCKSIRELQTHITNNSKLNHLINAPSVSQFTRKNSTRDYRIFEDIFYYLVEKASRKFGRYNLVKDIPPIKIVDSTVILVALKLAPMLKMDNDRAAIKISTLFNGEYPEKINIVNGKTNDRKCIDGMFKEKDCIYVFDRGYNDYSWYDNLSDNNIKFITRGVSNSTVMEDKILDSNIEKNIYDTQIVMGTSTSKNLTHNNFREIMTFDEDGEPITFLTNISNLSKEDVILVYKKRWEIELFFKWIKQNLRIKKFIGYNENAVKIQVFTALISYMLIYMFCKKSNNEIKYKMLVITRIIKVNILEIHSDVLLNFSD